MAERFDNGGDDLVKLYLDDIGQHEILDHEQIVDLFNDIALAKEVIDRCILEDRQPSQEEIRTINKGTENAHFVAASNLKLVVSVAKTFQGQGLSLLDLIQEGNEGLYHSIKNFDHTMGIRFSTYATLWIKQAIRRAIPEGQTIRITDGNWQLVKSANAVASGSPQTEYFTALKNHGFTDNQIEKIKITLQMSNIDSLQREYFDGAVELQDKVSGPDNVEDTVFTNIDLHLSHQLLEEIMEGYSERDRYIVFARHGVMGTGDKMSFEALGRELGISRQAAQQRYRTVLLHIRRNAKQLGDKYSNA